MSAGARPQGAPSPEDVRASLVVRALEERDLEQADRIMRVAFGTHLNVPDPTAAFGDAQYVASRYRAAPQMAFCAELDGQVVGSNFATRWGSFAFFGPLTVRVDLWNRGIATRLVEPVVDLFERWGVRSAGLFTFPESPKHVGLYNKFGFWPQQLNPLLAKEISPADGGSPVDTFSALRARGREREVLEQCRKVTGSIYPGLDLEPEILAVEDQGLGETVLSHEADEVVGFAVCHCGAGSEAGSGACYIKFGAVTGGDGASTRFERLLEACEKLAGERGLSRLLAGVNAGRRGAYRSLLDRGYRAAVNGLTMLRPDDPAYNHPGTYVIDDLR
jgi:predicted N-acetyltransferase YhbS